MVPADGRNSPINYVLDGDTFWHAGEKIRVADIDTPDTNQAQCPSERAPTEPAKRRLRQLLTALRYSLKRTGTDRSKRTLWVVTNRNSSIGDQLVREGLARTWTERREPWC